MHLPNVRIKSTLDEGARVKFVIDNTSCSRDLSSGAKAKLVSLLIAFPKNIVVDIINIVNAGYLH